MGLAQYLSGDQNPLCVQDQCEAKRNFSCMGLLDGGEAEGCDTFQGHVVVPMWYAIGPLLVQLVKHSRMVDHDRPVWLMRVGSCW